VNSAKRSIVARDAIRQLVHIGFREYDDSGGP
jgi:hypothetical protein